MTKKFIIALHGAPELRDPITEYLKTREWRVWHWYADLWLLSEVPDRLRAGILYREIELAIPAVTGVSMMVLEMDSDLRFYGRAQKESWPWMGEFWGTPDIPPSTITMVIEPIQPEQAQESS